MRQPFDALVFGNSGDGPDEWFQFLDSSHSKSFDDWKYITSFSSSELGL